MLMNYRSKIIDFFVAKDERQKRKLLLKKDFFLIYTHTYTRRKLICTHQGQWKALSIIKNRAFSKYFISVDCEEKKY